MKHDWKNTPLNYPASIFAAAKSGANVFAAAISPRRRRNCFFPAKSIFAAAKTGEICSSPVDSMSASSENIFAGGENVFTGGENVFARAKLSSPQRKPAKYFANCFAAAKFRG